ncbi:MAG TPA: hypothetical protein VJ765_08870 [Chitinophagaceae bacterium]|nr:hypothetical protein [Chitinophagaceae bacterium]
MKLYKIMAKAGGSINKEYNLKFPPRQYLLEMSKIESDFDQEIKYFKKYQEGN